MPSTHGTSVTWTSFVEIFIFQFWKDLILWIFLPFKGNSSAV